MQGCSLRCWWCHNPDSQPKLSLETQVVSVDQLVEQVVKDHRYWTASGGGVTLSGGEPLLQAKPVQAFLQKMQTQGHHCMIETSGAVPLPNVQRVAAHVDGWLWDIKSVDAPMFAQATGGHAQQVLDNLFWLLRETDTPIRIRVPLIAGLNNHVDAVKQMADWLSHQRRSVPVEVLPGHDTGRQAKDIATCSARPKANEVADARQLLSLRSMLFEESS